MFYILNYFPVSQLQYNRTDFTLALKILTFALSVKFLNLQALFNNVGYIANFYTIPKCNPEKINTSVKKGTEICFVRTKIVYDTERVVIPSSKAVSTAPECNHLL